MVGEEGNRCAGAITEITLREKAEMPAPVVKERVAR
jgi:hypothetical protein